MEHDERVPGVTFRLTRGEQRPPIDTKLHKAVGHVELYAEINDFNVWADVLQRLNGMRVYTVENLAEEMISVAQKKARDAERKLQQDKEELRSELEKAKQRISFMEAELQRLQVMEGELKELESAIRAVNYEQMLRDKGDLR